MIWGLQTADPSDPSDHRRHIAHLCDMYFSRELYFYL